MDKKLITAGVAVLVFLRPLVSGLTYPWANSYAQTAILLMCAVWLLGTIRREESLFKTSLDVPLLTFFLCSTVSGLQSVDKAVSLNHTYQLMSCVLLYFIITNNLRTKRQQDVIILALFLSTTLVCIYGIYQYFWGLDSTRRIVELYYSDKYPDEFMVRLGTNKAFSTFVYPPALAGFLILVMPLSLSVSFRSVTRLSRILYVLPLLIFSCLILTFSKAGFLAGLLSMLVFVFIWLIVIKKLRKSVVIISLIIVMFTFSLLFVSGYLPKVNLSAFMDSFAVRIGYWKAVPAMARNHFPLGSGPGTFGIIYPQYRHVLARETQMAHNNYLQVLVETGIAGFIAFLWIWARLLRRGISLIMRQEQKLLALGYFAGMTGFLIQSLVDFGLYIPGIAMTVFLFLALLETREKPLPASISASSRTKLALTLIVLLSVVYMLWAVRRPMLGERYFARSFNYIKMGKTNMAIPLLERAIEYCPRQASYYFQLGLIYERRFSPGKKQDGKDLTGRIWLDKAIQSYERAITYNPHVAIYHSRLGWLYWSKSGGRNKDLVDKAISELQRAVSCYPVMPRYHKQLGRLYHLAGEYEEAKKEYNLTLKYKEAVYRQSQRDQLNSILKQVETWLEELEKLGT